MNVMLLRVVLILLLAASLAACSAAPRRDLPPLATPDFVDPAKMQGQWFVIANIPYFAERGRVAGRVEYRPRPDGRFDDLYHSRKGGFDAPETTLRGLAWILDPGVNTRWRARFYWPFTFDFTVIHLDAEAGHLLLAHPSRDYAWIMAREPRISAEAHAALLERFAVQGYDTDRILKIAQFPEQLGQPGFQQP